MPIQSEVDSFNKTNLAEWRVRVLDRILYIMFGLGTLLFLVVIIIYFNDPNFLILIPIYASCYLIIIAITFIKRIPYILRSGLFLLILYILAVVGLKDTGLSSDGRVFLLAFVAVTALFFGRKIGLIALGITGITLVFFAWMFSQHIWVIPEANQAVTADANAWISGGIVLITLAMLLVFTTTYLLQRLDRMVNSNSLMVDQLRQHRATLEDEVVQRTADLSVALAQAEQQADEKARLAEEVSNQRILMHQQSIPIIPVSADILIMPLVGEFDTERLNYAQEAALNTIATTRVRNLILDVTGVPTIDTGIAQGLLHIVDSCRLLGSRVTIVGIRPEVAETLVHLGLDLHAFDTSADLSSALQLLFKTHS